MANEVEDPANKAITKVRQLRPLSSIERERLALYMAIREDTQAGIRKHF